MSKIESELHTNSCQRKILDSKMLDKLPNMHQIPEHFLFQNCMLHNCLPRAFLAFITYNYICMYAQYCISRETCIQEIVHF